MKNLKKSNLFSTCLAMLVSFSVIGFVGCEKEDDAVVSSAVSDSCIDDIVKLTNELKNIKKQFTAEEDMLIENIFEEYRETENLDTDYLVSLYSKIGDRLGVDINALFYEQEQLVKSFNDKYQTATLSDMQRDQIKFSIAKKMSNSRKMTKKLVKTNIVRLKSSSQEKKCSEEAIACSKDCYDDYSDACDYCDAAFVCAMLVGCFSGGSFVVWGAALVGYEACEALSESNYEDCLENCERDLNDCLGKN